MDDTFLFSWGNTIQSLVDYSNNGLRTVTEFLDDNKLMTMFKKTCFMYFSCKHGDSFECDVLSIWLILFLTIGFLGLLFIEFMFGFWMLYI